jgi:hypothetical protein
MYLTGSQDTSQIQRIFGQGKNIFIYFLKKKKIFFHNFNQKIKTNYLLDHLISYLFNTLF